MSITKHLNILVIGPSWIGDMVMAQSLLKVIKQRHPSSFIDVLATEWTYPLLERMEEVHDGILFPVNHGNLLLGKRLALGKLLREKSYDWAIILPRSLKSGIIPWIAKVKRRTGFLGEFRWGLLNDIRYDWDQHSRTVDRFISLALEPREALPKEWDTPQLRSNSQAALEILNRLGQPLPTAPILALCPGAAFGPAKRWPSRYYAAVARQKLQEGWAVWLLGSGQEKKITAEIQNQSSGACLDLSGKLNLTESLDLLSLANLVVTNDSGLMHVASGLGRPMVAIFGSSDPKINPPLSSKAKILYLGVECSPCFQRKCPLGHFKCMEDLKPEQVLESIEALSL